MHMTKNRAPIYSMDQDGREIVLVPLANHPQPAKLFREDFERLSEEGLGYAWTLNGNGKGLLYVRASCRGVSGTLAMVSRLIVSAGRGRCVRYLDGDRLNLRFDNLLVEPGYAKGATILDGPETP